MFAHEVRAAALAAEAASRAAQHAHAAAQIVLAGLEAASSATHNWDQQAASEQVPEHQEETGAQQHEPGGPVLFQPALVQPKAVLNDLPIADFYEAGHYRQPANPARGVTKPRSASSSALQVEPASSYEQATPAPYGWNSEDALAAEVAEPIYANLIQFPREVVATRKMRPRNTESPLATTATGTQLSIFEVDPGSISMDSTLDVAAEPSAPAWMREEWAGMQLEEQRQVSAVEESEPFAALRTNLELAPLSRRLLAPVVDSTLVAGAFVAVASLVLHQVKILPSLHTLEFVTVFALLAMTAAYQTLFITFAGTTPGMWYAGIAFRTIEGSFPSRRQRWARLMALPLSILPLGLGLAWSLFDESHLTWHDRLSGTYLRRP